MLPRSKLRLPPPIPPELPVPCILAADPVRSSCHGTWHRVPLPTHARTQYTTQAFHTRTHLYAHPLTFRDIAEGKLPEIASKPVGAPKPNNPPESPSPEGSLRGHSPSKSSISTAASLEANIIEMVVCSFALHLIEKPSELFALLWELRCVSRSRRPAGGTLSLFSGWPVHLAGCRPLAVWLDLSDGRQGS